MKSRIIFVFLCLVTSFCHYGQHLISGKVVDGITHEPLAFANLIFDNNPALQTISDINGFFRYESPTKISGLNCSYVGYTSVNLPVAPSLALPLEIQLYQSNNALQEVVVTQGENPALRIIRKAIENKESNNPEKISTFRYRCYNKLVSNLKENKNSKNKKNQLDFLPKGNPFFIMESVSQRKFIAPDISEETVLASRVSGFKNPSFASLATDMQPFAFYEDNIKLIKVYYLNPISRGSIKKYKYRLEETVLKGKDTIFIISYEPRKNKNFDGLKGILYINSNRYAIQNVIATPATKAKINLKIQQQYQWVNNQYWFPEQLNYALEMEDVAESGLNFIIEGKSYVSEVEVGIPLKKKEFSDLSVLIDPKATKRDSIFWETSRYEKLTADELRTYKRNDSLGEKNNFDGAMKTIEKLSKNRIGYRFLDFDLNKTLLMNKYERIRLGTGIYTNELFSKRLSIGGFGGYGVRDHQWKYGGEVSYMFLPENELSLGIQHQSNLMEIGNYGLRSHANRRNILRSLISSTFDEIQQNALMIKFKAWHFLTGNVSIHQTKIEPAYRNTLGLNGIIPNRMRTTDLTFYGRIAFKEKIVQALGTKQSLGSAYPILYFLYTKGLKQLLESDLQYDKLEAAVEHSFYLRNFGKTRFRLESGYINGSLPPGLLFTGEGSFDRDNPYVTPNFFQTMRPYEFISDRYLNLYLSHEFGTLLFKTSFFQPNISVHQNLSWGTMHHDTSLTGTFFKTKENIFLEAGLQIDNIIKINTLNLGYLGFGTAVFQRYGYYSNPNMKDNTVFKFTVNFTIK